MRLSQVMSSVLVGVVLVMSAAATVSSVHADPKAGASKPEPSGRLKAYEGPEGEIILMVEVNSGKQMLVQFKNIDKDIDGKTMLYEVRDASSDGKDVFYTYKRGSKTADWVVLTLRDGSWEFYHPTKHNKGFYIYYSDVETKKSKLDEVVNAYKP